MRLPFGNGCGHVVSAISAKVVIPGVIKDGKFLHPNTPKPLLLLADAIEKDLVAVLRRATLGMFGKSARPERIEACTRLMNAITKVFDLSDFSAKLSISRLASMTEMNEIRVKRGLKTLRRCRLLTVRRKAQPRHRKHSQNPHREITTHVVPMHFFKLLHLDKAMRAASLRKQEIQLKRNAKDLNLSSAVRFAAQGKKSNAIFAAMNEVYKDAVPDPRGKPNKERFAALKSLLNQ